MATLSLGRYALSGGAAAVLLAGCGGSQPPVGAPGAMPQTFALAAHANHVTSWMLPEAQREDLLYVGGLTTSSHSALFVYGYPSLSLVGTLELGGTPVGLCSDTHGDIYVTEEVKYAGQLLEFKHGASNPERTIPTAPYQPNSCSVAPKSGDLAVAANEIRGSYGSALLVYHKAKGSPTIYKSTPNMHAVWSTAYGAGGQNFLLGFKTCHTYYYSCYNFNVLPPRGSILHNLRVPSVHQHSLGNDLGWDGTYLVILARELARYQVRRKKLDEVGVVLNTEGGAYQFCLVPKYGQVVVSNGQVEIYDYPSGQYEAYLSVEQAYGLAFSLAPSSLSIRR